MVVLGGYEGVGELGKRETQAQAVGRRQGRKVVKE